MVILLYLLANLAYLAALPIHGRAAADTEPDAAFMRGIDHAKDDRVATAVLERFSPGVGVPLMAVVIMISTFGCVNGLTLMGARLYYAMARDGLFFQAVGKLSPQGVPRAGLWLQCLWSIALIFTGSYNELLDYIIFAALLFYILTVGAVFVLRVNQPNAPRPYRAWGYPLLPALYIVLCAVIMLSLLVVRPVYSWPSFIIVLTGIPVYFLWRVINQNHQAPPWAC
jgi:APA family basic amino acid/polyamine antiporter